MPCLGKGTVRNKKSKLRLTHFDSNGKLNSKPDVFSERWAPLAKVNVLGPQKNKNSKNTFIVETFPKYG